MDLLLVLLGTLAFPVACLGFVLWMGRLEDTIPVAVRRATTTPDPAPILTVPVRRPASIPPAAADTPPPEAPSTSALDAIPAQRTEGVPAPVAPTAPAAPAAPVALAAPAAPAAPVALPPAGT